MTRTKYFLAVVTLIAGCSSSSNPDGIFNDTTVFEIDTPSGPAQCIRWVGINKGGLSCYPVGEPTPPTKEPTP